jgi:hypothetical protein
MIMNYTFTIHSIDSTGISLCYASADNRLEPIDVVIDLVNADQLTELEQDQHIRDNTPMQTWLDEIDAMDDAVIRTEISDTIIANSSPVVLTSQTATMSELVTKHSITTVVIEKQT